MVGIEPTTSRLSVVRSYHLSYIPKRGTIRFELITPWSSIKCSTNWSYVPESRWKDSNLRQLRPKRRALPNWATSGYDPNGIWTRDTTVTGLRDNHFTIGSRWEKRELHPQRFLCNSFTDCRHTYLIVAFLPYGSGGTWTHNFQVKSPLLYHWVTDPLKGLNCQGAGGGLSITLLEYHWFALESSGVCQSQDWNWLVGISFSRRLD